MPTKQSKKFSIHPNVIKSIILEQAGDTCKALAELVMNSIDAQATYVDITIDSLGYTVRDDGVGFKDKQQVIDYFGTFGTPHAKNDATFGVFRIGRGQCFAISKSTWRSGKVGMEVDLNGLEGRSDVGYVIKEYEEDFLGCEVRGEFFKPLHTEGNYLNADHFDQQLSETIKNFSDLADDGSLKLQKVLSSALPKEMGNKFFARLFELLLLVEVPVKVNGVQITQRLKLNLYHSTPNADFYTFPRRDSNIGLLLLNQGVHITSISFTVPFVINFKVKPKLNMARNSISKDCKVYRKAIGVLLNKSFQAVLKEEPYFVNHKHGLFDQLLCANINSPLHGTWFPSQMDANTFEEFLSTIRVNIVSSQVKKLTLLEFVNNLCFEAEESQKKYRIANTSIIKRMGGVNQVKSILEELNAEYSVVYGIDGGDISYRFFEILEGIYDELGWVTEIEEAFNSLEKVSFEQGHLEKEIKFENRKITYGHYSEVNQSTITRNEDLIEVLDKAIAKIRTYIQALMPNVVCGERNIFADNELYEIRLLSLPSGIHATMSAYGWVQYASLEDKHYFVFDLKRLKDAVNGLNTYHGYFFNSVAARLYLAMMNARYDEKKPLHVLHDLRKRNEEMLFVNEEFREFLYSVDLLFVSYIRNKKPPKFMSASAMKNTQKSLSIYKDFFDTHFDGLVPELDKQVSDILAVKN